MKKGVLLFNLGGPENLNEVRPFLYNLFSDPEIIQIKNDVLRKSLAWLVAYLRQKKSRQLYRQIGGGSPLRKITEAQAAALEENLRLRGIEARIYIGMRCWEPSIDEAVQQILADRIDKLILLPLFPQFSGTTTGSCLKRFTYLDRQFRLSGKMDIATIQSWFDEPLYIETLSDLIKEGLSHFAVHRGKDVFILYSAHSIPARYIQQGDPYLQQTQKTVELINARIGDDFPSELAFQSKIGPVKWLEPSTQNAILNMAKNGTKKIIVVPISFVSDHIETLQEIDIAYRRIALNAGLTEFIRAESPNLNPKFIESLTQILINRARM